MKHENRNVKQLLLPKLNSENTLKMYYNEDIELVKRLNYFDPEDNKNFISLRHRFVTPNVLEVGEISVGKQTTNIESINNLGKEIKENKEQEMLRLENLFNERKLEEEKKRLEDKINLIKGEIDNYTSIILNINNMLERNEIELDVLNNYEKYNVINLVKDKLKNTIEYEKHRSITKTIKMEHENNIRNDKIESLTEENRRNIENKNMYIKCLADCQEELKKLNFENKKIKSELLIHYHKLLKEGKDTRIEGLIWIIKAIWSLNEEIMISQIPQFLDDKAIQYLFKIAKMDIKAQNVKNVLDDVRGNLKRRVKKSKSLKKRSLIADTIFQTSQV